MTLEQLDHAAWIQIESTIRAIRHDLGKYICFEQRFIVSEGDSEELRRALVSDLYRTRRIGDDAEDCGQVWARIRPAELDSDPDVKVIDQAIRDILGGNMNGSMEELQRLSVLAQEVRDASRRLMDRWLSRQESMEQHAGGISNG